MKEPKGSTTQPRQGPTGAAANAVSIESLREIRRGLWAYMSAGEIEAFDDALTELAARRESDAALRAENERLRLIETGAKDSEALVAHLRAENEALRKANAEYLCYCQPEVHADGVTDPAVTCPRCAALAAIKNVDAEASKEARHD